MVRISCISRLEVFVKESYDFDPPAIELIYIVEKHNTLITINFGTYFCILEFSFKVCNTAWIVPSVFGDFSPLFFIGFKMKYSNKMEDGFYTF